MVVVAKIVRDSDRIESGKPRIKKHDFSSVEANTKKGELHAKGSRYNTRIRRSAPTQVRTRLICGAHHASR